MLQLELALPSTPVAPVMSTDSPLKVSLMVGSGRSNPPRRRYSSLFADIHCFISSAFCLRHRTRSARSVSDRSMPGEAQQSSDNNQTATIVQQSITTSNQSTISIPYQPKIKQQLINHQPAYKQQFINNQSLVNSKNRKTYVLQSDQRGSYFVYVFISTIHIFIGTTHT